MALKQRNKHSGGIGEKVIEASGGIERKAEEALTCLFHELPLWMQDNHFIVSGYRRESLSFRKSLHSLTYIHNETVNIYSHFLAAIFFIIIGVYMSHTLPQRYQTATTTDMIFFATFFASAGACLGMSATYHTISNHSERVAKVGNKLDYLGIVVLIIGSFVPSIHYGFWCHPKLTWAYGSMISILGFGCAAVSVLSQFRTPAWRPFRASLFIGMGLSSVVPVFHGLCIYGFEALGQQMGIRWVMVEGLLYVVGAVIYAARVPERWTPKKYDLLGASHQIFHFFVVAAAMSHLVGLVKAFDYLHSRDALVCG